MPILGLHLQPEDSETLIVGSSKWWPNPKVWEPLFKPSQVQTDGSWILSQWNTGKEKRKCLRITQLLCWKCDPDAEAECLCFPTPGQKVRPRRDISFLADSYPSARRIATQYTHTGKFITVHPKEGVSRPVQHWWVEVEGCFSYMCPSGSKGNSEGAKWKHFYFVSINIKSCVFIS